jgi:hypothetical protein
MSQWNDILVAGGGYIRIVNAEADDDNSGSNNDDVDIDEGGPTNNKISSDNTNKDDILEKYRVWEHRWIVVNVSNCS